MTWLVTGAAGQLGSDLMRVLDGRDVVGLPRRRLDITDEPAVRAAVSQYDADLIINAAAYTDVEGAEADEETATRVNADGPAVLARVCAERGLRLVHVSTAYVFPGDATSPYAEDEPVAPRSAYGRSKAAGEHAVLTSHAQAWVVRTAWVYGQTGSNFVKTIARLERERDAIDVVDDQRGSPTWSRDLAAGLVALAAAVARTTATETGPEPGIYHCTNAGETTWCGFARAIFDELGGDPQRVRATTTDRFPRPAPRPAYSVLSDGAWRRAGLPALREWRSALHAAFEEAGPAFISAPSG